MNLPTKRIPRSVPERIPINDPQLLAKLWEMEEIGARQSHLTIISEHIDSRNADLTILAWEKFLSLFEDVDRRYSLNMENAKKNTAHLGFELSKNEDGLDALAAVLTNIDLADEYKFSGVKTHQARHLICNVGVLCAATAMKAAYALMRSTHANDPTSGLLELISRLDQHQQRLTSEIEDFKIQALMEISEQGFHYDAIELQTDLREFQKHGLAYWKIDYYSSSPQIDG